MTPIDIDELFELNPNYEIVSLDDEVLIIDNWYKNFDEIQKVLKQQTPIKFDTSSHDGRVSENFKDFYDCRVVFNSTVNNITYNNTIKEIEKILNEHVSDVRLKNDNVLLFNYFKYKTPYNNNMQAIPHTDGKQQIAGVIYIDEICSGGTAIYDLVPETTSGAGVVDVTDFKKEYKLEIKRILKAKPNRLVLYRGDIWHGAYIEDNKKYVDEWRINQVHFFGVEENG